MTETIERQPASFTVALRAQLALAFAVLARRPNAYWRGVILLGLLLMAAKDGVPGIHYSSATGAVRAEFFRPRDLAAEPGTFGLFVGLVVALWSGFTSSFRVWRDCDPSQRGPFWSLPVDRGHHELARVCAGAGAVLATSLTILVTVVVGAILGGHRGAPAAVPGVAWLAFLFGPVVLYALNSVLALFFDNAVLLSFATYWIGGLILGVAATTLVESSVGRVARQLFDGELSLFSATVEPWLRAVSGGEPQAFGQWLTATFLWLGIAIAGLLVANRLRRR